MKRKLFITVGILLNIAAIVIPFLGFKKWDILLVIVISAILWIINGIIGVTNNKIPLMWWFIQPKKRIFHKDLGELWAEESHFDGEVPKIHVYEYGFLSLRIIASIDIDTVLSVTSTVQTPIENIKRKLKNSLDAIHNVRELKKAESTLDQWDGYFDTASKRDDKLKDLGIK